LETIGSALEVRTTYVDCAIEVPVRAAVKDWVWSSPNLQAGVVVVVVDGALAD